MNGVRSSQIASTAGVVWVLGRLGDKGHLACWHRVLLSSVSVLSRHHAVVSSVSVLFCRLVPVPVCDGREVGGREVPVAGSRSVPAWRLIFDRVSVPGPSGPGEIVAFHCPTAMVKVRGGVVVSDLARPLGWVW